MVGGGGGGGGGGRGVGVWKRVITFAVQNADGKVHVHCFRNLRLYPSNYRPSDPKGHLILTYID